jgi:hypothetical protein
MSAARRDVRQQLAAGARVAHVHLELIDPALVEAFSFDRVGQDTPELGGVLGALAVSSANLQPLRRMVSSNISLPT